MSKHKRTDPYTRIGWDFYVLVGLLVIVIVLMVL
jgi:hypothetical protein